MNAVVAADGAYFLHTGKELVIAYNSDGANPYTATLTTADDPYGRGESATCTLIAGEVNIIGPIPAEGWRQPGTGQVYVDVNNAAVKIGVIVVP
jgi:hypothetical protein